MYLFFKFVVDKTCTIIYNIIEVRNTNSRKEKTNGNSVELEREVWRGYY